MVVTRKQAADSCQVAHSQDVHSLDAGPHSNLNLLASSASCEALSLGSGRRTSTSTHRAGSHPLGVCVATFSAAESSPAAAAPVYSDMGRAAGSSPLNAVTTSAMPATQMTPGLTGLAPSAPSLPSSVLPHTSLPHSPHTSCVPSATAVNGSPAAVDTVPSGVVSNAPPAVVNNVLSATVNSVSTTAMSAIQSRVVDVQSVVSAVPLLASSSSQMAVAAVHGAGPSPVRSQTVINGSGEKAASLKQYKIVYRPPLSNASAPKPVSASPSLGLGTVLPLRPPTTTSLPALPTAYTLCAAPSKDGGPPRHILVPISHSAPAHVSTVASMLSSKVAIRPLKSCVSQMSGSSGTPSPATMIVMSPLASAVNSSNVTVVSSADSTCSSTTLTPVLPAMAPSSPAPITSHSVSVTGSIVGQTVTPGGAVVGHSVSTGGPVVGHSVSTGGPVVGHSVSTDGPVVGHHCVSYALSQLAHTAKADMTAQTQNNVARVSVSGQLQPSTTTVGLVEASSARMDMTGQVHMISMGTPTPDPGSTTTGVIVAPSPQPTLLSTPLLPIMAPTPVHTEQSTSAASPGPERTEQPTSLAASTAEAAVSAGSLMDGEAVSWDRRCTLKLIQLYKEHQIYLTDHHYKKKSVWELIATKLRQSIPDSPPFRWNHVENKWKNMTKKFRDCVDLGRRGFMVSKCNFFDEIADIYKYSPDEDQKKAAEGLRALKSAAPRYSSLLAPSHYKDGSTTRGGVGGTPSSAAMAMKTEKHSAHEDGCGGAGPASQTDGVLVKKKKYAHLDAQSSSSSSSSSSSALPPPTPPLLLPHPPPPELSGGGKEMGVDIVALLHQLRGDRVKQDSARMERLEQMHCEKMAMFSKFLDILQQSKQSE